MAAEGPNITGTGADDSAVGTNTWSNPGNITADDTSYATLFLAGQTHYLKATNFGFSIPTDATIDGIEVGFNRSKTIGGFGDVTDEVISIVLADGSIGSEDKSAGASWNTTTFVTDTFGGSSDLWSETWAFGDINDSDFGVVLSATVFVPSESAATARVDFVEITVTYTEAGGDIKTVSSVAIASVKTVDGIAIASVKTIDTISNV